jgi:hypothetical protein
MGGHEAHFSQKPQGAGTGGACCAEALRATVAAKGHKMQAARFLVSLQAPGHVRIVISWARRVERRLPIVCIVLREWEVKVPVLSQKTRQGRGTQLLESLWARAVWGAVKYRAPSLGVPCFAGNCASSE